MAKATGEYISRQLLLDKLKQAGVDGIQNAGYKAALQKFAGIVRTTQGRDIPDVVYICDGSACDPDKASCKHGGPCRHTTKLEHAAHFVKFDKGSFLDDRDHWYEMGEHSEGRE